MIADIEAIRKVTRIGGSLVVVIPPNIAKIHEIKAGDSVKLTTDNEGIFYDGRITLEKVTS